MRFPLSMTAGMAGYIARNKMSPKPEWQADRSKEAKNGNPFQIIHTVTNGQRTPHPMIKKRFPLVLMLEPLFRCVDLDVGHPVDYFL